MAANEEEKKIIEFWDKKEIYEKSMKKNSKGKKFYMMDGPPYATGNIHMGTALNKVLKDIAMRSRRLQGFDIFDRPGYDTHGVPIEFQVEKEIGSRGKQDIEKFGVKKFVERCKEFATKYIDVMNNEFKNLGVWMDWNNPYLTLSDEWIEGSWAAFKEAEKKGLLYLGKYPVHICTRCGTAVAYNEIEYGKQKDTSVFVKFPLKKKKNTFLLIWTTTPWTLPANTAVMVNPNVDYQEVEMSDGEKWIIAKALVPKVMGEMERGFTAKKEFKGKDMEGWEYESPLAKHLKLKIKNGYKVILSARYVTIEDGTGLVHCAPGHGKEDYEVGKEYGIDMPSPVAINGFLTEEAGKYAGKKAREVDLEIMNDLEKEGYLVYKKEYEHDYPLCWRDKSPLLMVAQPQWFIKVSEIQEKLLKENEGTVWLPKWMQLRMKAWLEGLSDWPVSRQRYWGTPLPIWVNENTGERIVVGTIEELKKLSGKSKIGVHKPEIDEIEIKRDGKVFKRVPEVLDVWFDSGVASWAALEYPRKKDKFDKYWPADLNIEGRDQFRGWWNSQMILSQIVFDKKPFDSIVVHGMVLDLGKKKMSKSLGNVVSPADVIDKYGRDYMRYYFAKFSKGEDFSYDEDEFEEIGKVIMMLGNVNNFVNQLNKKKAKSNIEDKWILSKFNSLVKNVTEAYNTYRFPDVIQQFEQFIVMDLSRTYIKMIRDRADETYDLMNEIRFGLLKMIAPICPFVTENIWQELREKKIVSEESIHLSKWPEMNSSKIDEKLEKAFEEIAKLIEAGLRERDKVQIGLKWPLAKAIITSKEKIEKEFSEVILNQLNVKRIEFKKGEEINVDLDIKMTPELEAEGYSRELARKIQAERKNAGLKKGDLIKLKVFADKVMIKMLEKNKKFLKERTNSERLEILDSAVAKMSAKVIKFAIKDKNLAIEF